MSFPCSVYELGDWLLAHPHVKRLRVPDDVWRDYFDEVVVRARLTAPARDGAFEKPVITWRRHQALIASHAWYQRDALFPSSQWRRAQTANIMQTNAQTCAIMDT